MKGKSFGVFFSSNFWQVMAWSYKALAAETTSCTSKFRPARSCAEFLPVIFLFTFISVIFSLDFTLFTIFLSALQLSRTTAGGLGCIEQWRIDVVVINDLPLVVYNYEVAKLNAC